MIVFGEAPCILFSRSRVGRRLARRRRLGRVEFVLTNGEQFVVEQCFELGLEDVDHGRRVTERMS